MSLLTLSSSFQAFNQFWQSLLPKEAEADGDKSEAAGSANLITVHLKNDMKLEGCLLTAIDSNMNMQLDVSMSKGGLPPYMQNLKTINLRGNSIKYVTLDRSEVGDARLRELNQNCRNEME